MTQKLLRYSYFKIAILIALYVVIRKLYNTVHRKYYKLPHGPIGFPIIGCLLSLMNGYKFMMKMTKYGDIATYHFGVRSIIVINNIKVAKKLYQNPQTLSVANMSNDKIKHFVHEEVEIWQDRRKFAQRIFSQQFNSNFLTTSLKNYFHTQIVGIITSLNDKPIYLRQYLRSIIFNTVMIATFGITLDDCVKNKFWLEFDRLAREAWDNVLLQPLLILLCGENTIFYKIFNKLIFRNKEHNHFDVWKDCLIKYVENNKTNNIKYNCDCLYFKMQQELNKTNSIYNYDTMMADLFALMGGALDTSSVTLEWAIINLCTYTNIQQKIYQQIYDACDGSINNINLSQTYLKNTSLLKAFIYETLRLYPIAAFARFRQNKSSKPIQIKIGNKEYQIPVNCLFHVNNFGMTRMKSNWNDSKDIDLDKINLQFWLDKNDNFRMNESLSMFGFGARNCVGQSLAVKSLHLILSLFIFKYKFGFEKNFVAPKMLYNPYKTLLQVSPEIPVIIVDR